MDNKKFLFVIHSLNGGGAERVMSVLCNNLARRGNEVHLGLYKRTDNDYPLDDEVNLHILSEKKGKSKIGNTFYRVKQTSKLIKQLKPDFVIPFMGTVVIETFLASRFKKTTFISTVRIDPLMAAYSKCEKKILFLVNSFSNAVFVQNNMQKECYPKWVQKKTFVVYNPVSQVFLDNQLQDHGKIVNIATSGRLTKQKNHKMLIDAIRIVTEKHPDVKLTIYGDGDLREKLDKYISQKKLENSVKMFGRTNNMLSELLKNDLFVLSSDYEGMPNALLEAMALQMPCISTDCRTGPSDMIKNYESGILVPVNDAEKMAEAIIFMIENPGAANSMGKNARKFVTENCTSEIVVDKFINECMKFERK